jgi:hypothetical protein
MKGDARWLRSVQVVTAQVAASSAQVPARKVIRAMAHQAKTPALGVAVRACASSATAKASGSLGSLDSANNAVERTASQPTGRVAEVGLSGGWLSFAHFWRWADER